MADMEAEDYKHYVCIEPGYVMSEITVPAHQEFVLSQIITL